MSDFMEERQDLHKEQLEKLFGKKTKSLRETKRVKQTVKRQIQESFEDEEAVAEMCKEPAFWENDDEAYRW